MTIETKVYEMVELIRNSKEYKDVQRIKTRIYEKRSIYNGLRKFQYNQKELYRQKLSKNEIEKRLEVMQKDFQELQKNNEVRQYTEALRKLNEKIYTINQKIYNMLEDDILL